MRLTDPIRFSRLIEEIYDSILDRSRWKVALETFCLEIDGCSALFADTPSILVQHGCAPKYWETYLEKYSRNNPWFDVALMGVQEGGVGAFYGVTDVTSFQQCEFYKEWLKPQSWGDCSLAMLERSTKGFSMLSAVRYVDQEPFGKEDLALLEALLPHAQKAAKLGRLFDAQTAQISGMTEVIERIKCAAFLVSRSGRIIFANTLANAALADGIYLKEQAGLLTLQDDNELASLRAALTTFGNAPVVKVLKRADGDKVLSVIPPSERSGDLAIVLFFSSENAPTVPGPLLTETYGVTAAEIRVLVALMKGRTVDEMAAEFSITPRTIRAHLEGLFVKTGTTRQLDLVRKVLALAPSMHLFEQATPTDAKTRTSSK